MEDRNFTYSKLYRETQKNKGCAIATFDKHLKGLVREGLVNRESAKSRGQQSRYWVNPDESTKFKEIGIPIEGAEDEWEKGLESTLSSISMLAKPSKQGMKSPEIDIPSEDELVNRIIQLYNVAAELTLGATAHFLPRITEMRFKRHYPYRLAKLENIFTQLEKINPEFHNRVCLLIAIKRIKGNYHGS